MQIEETTIVGAFVIRFEPVYDVRGYFVRRFCSETFARAGLCSSFKFDSSSVNTLKHTLRGMHFQTQPFEETKLVSCVRGAIFDVVVDLRINSSTQKKWFGIELNDSESTALYIPPGCAHGFITLCDNTQVDYKLDAIYSPEHARGIRFDDPEIAIDWPAQPCVISDRDKGLPLLKTLIK